MHRRGARRKGASGGASSCSGKDFPHLRRCRVKGPTHAGPDAVGFLRIQMVPADLVVDAAGGDPEKAGRLRLITAGPMEGGL